MERTDGACRDPSALKSPVRYQCQSSQTRANFLSVGGQIGKSWPFLASLTDNWLVGNSDPTAAEIAGAVKGLGWSASGGYYFGGQLAGPADWSIFNPIYDPFNPGGAGPANLWGVGLMTPQAGLGLGYTLQGPTLAAPLPPHHTSEGP